jgi:Cys-rich protein (TIGR01571 family)
MQGQCLSTVCCPASVYGKNVSRLSPEEASAGGDHCAACMMFEAMYILTHLQMLFTTCVFCTPLPILPPCTMFIHAQARKAIRARYQLPETPCGDEVVTCFCSTCALIQVCICVCLRVFMCGVYVRPFERGTRSLRHRMVMRWSRAFAPRVLWYSMFACFVLWFVYDVYVCVCACACACACVCVCVCGVCLLCSTWYGICKFVYIYIYIHTSANMYLHIYDIYVY